MVGLALAAVGQEVAVLAAVALGSVVVVSAVGQEWEVVVSVGSG